jgi:hypothetical protein
MSASGRALHPVECPQMAASRPTAVAGHRPGGIDPLQSPASDRFGGSRHGRGEGCTLKWGDVKNLLKRLLRARINAYRDSCQRR